METLLAIAAPIILAFVAGIVQTLIAHVFTGKPPRFLFVNGILILNPNYRG